VKNKPGLFYVSPIKVLLYFLFLISACNTTDSTPKPVVAKVGEVSLYLSEIEAIKVPYNNETDSLNYIENYVENWVKSQLFLKKANEFLPVELKEIDRQIEDYRKSLLTFNYEQELLSKNVNTKVSEEEINNYYNTFKNNFKLAETIIKPKYLVVESDIITLDSIKAWVKSNNALAHEQFENAALSFGITYCVGEDWISFETFKEKLPKGLLQKGNLLSNNKYVQYEEDGLMHLFRTIEFGKKGDVAPLEYKLQDIEKIIVNKRKIDYLKRIKDKIYNDAINKNEFEIYDL